MPNTEAANRRMDLTKSKQLDAHTDLLQEIRCLLGIDSNSDIVSTLENLIIERNTYRDTATSRELSALERPKLIARNKTLTEEIATLKGLNRRLSIQARGKE